MTKNHSCDKPKSREEADRDILRQIGDEIDRREEERIQKKRAKRLQKFKKNNPHFFDKEGKFKF